MKNLSRLSKRIELTDAEKQFEDSCFKLECLYNEVTQHLNKHIEPPKLYMHVIVSTYRTEIVEALFGRYGKILKELPIPKSRIGDGEMSEETFYRILNDDHYGQQQEIIDFGMIEWYFDEWTKEELEECLSEDRYDELMDFDWEYYDEISWYCYDWSYDYDWQYGYGDNEDYPWYVNPDEDAVQEEIENELNEIIL